MDNHIIGFFAGMLMAIPVIWGVYKLRTPLQFCIAYICIAIFGIAMFYFLFGSALYERYYGS
jgi:hypothetical protein